GKEGNVLSLVTKLEESKLKKMAKKLGVELSEAVYTGGKLKTK
ncbi:RNA helicase, partial [Pseudomonas sp. GW456-E7]